MILELMATLAGVGLVLVAGYVLDTLRAHHAAQQFFRLRSPELPMAPGQSLLGGHVTSIVGSPRNWQKIDALHRKLGPTYGVFYGRQPAVLTTDLELIKTFILDESNEHLNRTNLGVPVAELNEDCIAFVEADQWRKLRRVLAPAISAHKVRAPNVHAEIEAVIDKFVAALDRRLKRAEAERAERFVVEDLEDIMHRYTLALVLTCFYKQDNTIDFDADQDAFTVLTLAGMRRMPLLTTCVTFPLVRSICQWLLALHPQGKLRAKLNSFIKQQTLLNLRARQQLERAKQEAALAGAKFDVDNFRLDDGSTFSRTLIDHVIDQFHDRKLSQSEYTNTTFFLFLAANKTSADGLSKILYQLACHQDVQDKLRQSILSKGHDCEYVSWVINESMRLFPPALIGCSRTIERDIHTKAGLVPAGTFVCTSTYTIHRMPEYWGQDAHLFRPERWSNAKSFHPLQFLPFGAGKRNCPGKDFALGEIKLLLDRLLRRYKFERSDRTADSMLFSAPLLIFTMSDLPTYVKISRLENS